MMQQTTIAVCGSSVDDPHLNALAEEVGRLLAEAGVALVCGGRGGVMAAACKGARAAGDLTVGVLPGNDPDAANPYVRLAIATGMGHARNAIIVQSARAVIAVGGAYGTLSEIALARAYGRTVVALMSWNLGDDATGNPRLLPAATPAEAVALALRAAGLSAPAPLS